MTDPKPDKALQQTIKIKRIGKNRRQYRRVAGFGANNQQPPLLMPWAPRPTILHEGWDKHNPNNRGNKQQ